MKNILLACLLLLSVLSAGAQNMKKADAVQQKAMIGKINQTEATIRSIDCTFTQVKTMSFLNDKLTSQGRMLFDGGGKLRWEYTSPYSYTFILNGQKVHIQSAKSKQTIDIRQSKLFQGIAQVMMNSVTGKSLADGSDFSCQMYVKGDEWIAMLVPQKKEMKKMFKDIRLHFDSRQQMVTQVEMTEPSGDTTVITLKNVKKNVHIDEKMFAAQ